MILHRVFFVSLPLLTNKKGIWCHCRALVLIDNAVDEVIAMESVLLQGTMWFILLEDDKIWASRMRICVFVDISNEGLSETFIRKVEANFGHLLEALDMGAPRLHHMV
ncbi:hypothetical protein L1987_64067 [Smallanthus sonchifolius]|uniref:Uncharacterized protein n=1 Tax=Smallanthus sonchifolius TaxID=185202 RepID=A0ACB9CEZ3_9ASTR|nr:hypothetical protein L1987_64067 [Smallanthus sonchifolius]